MESNQKSNKKQSQKSDKQIEHDNQIKVISVDLQFFVEVRRAVAETILFLDFINGMLFAR